MARDFTNGTSRLPTVVTRPDSLLTSRLLERLLIMGVVISRTENILRYSS